MVRKALYVLYNVSDAGNESITNRDYDDFFKELINNSEGIIDLQPAVKIRTSDELLDSLQLIFRNKAYDEIYLHFSTHGQQSGVDFGQWLVAVQDFGHLIGPQHNVKFCFFSSCFSESLAESIAQRIPVTIGSVKEVENTFAIDFQKEFYARLLKEKLTFHDAFGKALTLLKATRHQADIEAYGKVEPVILRGQGLKSASKKKGLNDLQIYLQDEEELERRLIYPTIVDQIKLIDERENLFLIYGEDDNTLDAFAETFNDLGYNESYILIRLSADDLKVIKEDHGEILGRSNLKVVGFITEEVRFNGDFLAVFDKKNIFEFDNLDLRFAQLNGISTDAVFPSSSNLTKGYEGHRFLFTEVAELFRKEDFLRFITGIEIPDESRKDYTFRFPCRPANKEVFFIDRKTISVQFFYIKYSQAKMANFLINNIRRIEGKRTPNIVINQHFQSQEDLEEILYTKISERLNLSLRPLRDQVWDLIEKPHIIVLKLDAEIEPATLKASLNKVIDTFSERVREYAKFKKDQPSNDTPTYVFILYHDSNLEALPLRNEERFSVKKIPDPERIGTHIDDWNKPFAEDFNLKLSHREVIDVIYKTLQESQLTDKDPVTAIEIICDGFRIPRKQILSIS